MVIVLQNNYATNNENTFDCFNFNHEFAYNNIAFYLYNGP